MPAAPGARAPLRKGPPGKQGKGRGAARLSVCARLSLPVAAGLWVAENAGERIEDGLLGACPAGLVDARGLRRSHSRVKRFGLPATDRPCPAFDGLSHHLFRVGDPARVFPRYPRGPGVRVRCAVRQ